MCRNYVEFCVWLLTIFVSLTGWPRLWRLPILTDYYSLVLIKIPRLLTLCIEILRKQISRSSFSSDLGGVGWWWWWWWWWWCCTCKSTLTFITSRIIAAKFRILSRLTLDLEYFSNKVCCISQEVSTESQGRALLWEALRGLFLKGSRKLMWKCWRKLMGQTWQSSNSRG